MPKDSKPWAKALETVPEMFHGMVEPELERIYSETQAQLDSYEPFKDIAENYDPEQVQNAVALADALENDPSGTFKHMAQFLTEKGLNPVDILGVAPPANPTPGVANPATSTGNSGEETDSLDSFKQLVEGKLGTLEQGFQQLGTYVSQKAQYDESEKQEREFLAYVDSIESQAETNEDPFDRDFIISRLAEGRTGDQAMEDLKSFITRFGGGSKKTEEDPPVVLGAGSLPSNQRSVTELTDSETEDMVVSYIKAQQAAAG